MQIHRFSQLSLLLGLALAGTALTGAQVNVAFTPASVSPGKTFTVTGSPAGAPLSVFSLKAGVGCDVTGIPDFGSALVIAPAPGATAPSVPLTGAAQTVTLTTPVQAKDILCLVATQGTNIGFAQQAVADSAKIDFAAKPTAGDTSISVSGDDGAIVSVWQFPSAYVAKSNSCGPADLLSGQVLALVPTAGGTANHIPIKGTAPFAITFSKPLQSGTQLCLFVTKTSPPAASTAYYSPFATVQDPKPTVLASFAQAPVGYSSSVLVNGANGVSIEIYQFNFGHEPTGNATCENDVQHPSTKSHKDFRLLPINATTGTGSSNIAKLSPDAFGNTALTLASPLQPGWQLCIAQLPPAAPPVAGAAAAAAPAEGAAPATPEFSDFITVTDPDKLPLGHAYYTAGAMVTNQNGSNGSSSAAEYIDFGFEFDGLNENPHTGGRHFGFDSFLSGRFSDVPVAASAPATTTATSGATSTTTSTGSLNILSTQESARVLGGVFLPIPIWKSESRSYSFFIAPLAKAAFETLLNPSASTTSGTSTGAAASVATFAPVYGYYAGGLRTGLRQYPATGDAAPRTWAQIDISVGKYSNLQSYICGPAASPVQTGLSAAPTNTSCYVAVPSGPITTTTTYNLLSQNRTVVPRLQIEGFIRFPNTPFVLGLDANLPQSVLSPARLDIQNKPGGNVAIYFGVSGNLLTLFKSFTVSGTGQ